MVPLLIAAGIFGGVVWMIAYAIFLLTRRDAETGVEHEARDGFTRFVEENYGSRFVPAQSLRQRSV